MSLSAVRETNVFGQVIMIKNILTSWVDPNTSDIFKSFSVTIAYFSTIVLFVFVLNIHHLYRLRGGLFCLIFFVYIW